MDEPFIAHAINRSSGKIDARLIIAVHVRLGIDSLGRLVSVDIGIDYLA